MTAAHLDDDQLTALQDGEGTSGDEAHLRGCDVCRARADALVAAAALVAAPPSPPSDETREATLAAVLRDAERPAVPRARRRAPAWVLPAAAVVALLALVTALVPRLGTNDDEDSAAAGRTSAESSGGDAGQGGGFATEEHGARAAGPTASDLGAVDDETELAGLVAQMGAAESTADAPTVAANRCDASFQAAQVALGPVRLRADLVWRGQAAEVLSDGDRAVVVPAGGCTTLAVVDLP